MQSIRLLNVDEALAERIEEGRDSFETTYGVALGAAADLTRAVVRQTLGLPSAAAHPWGGYLGVDTELERVIGTCGFKAPPTSQGEVEIAYFTFPEFERRGYATAMAGELVMVAAAFPIVRCILAHTLPQPNASTRVLQRIGMRLVGEVIDPEDGRVWRWELRARGAFI